MSHNDAAAYQTEMTTSTPPPRKRRACSRCGCVLAVLVLLLIAGFFGARYYFHQMIPAEDWKDVHEFETKVVSLPPEWHQPAEPPALESVQLLEQLTVTMEEMREKYQEFISYSATSPTLLSRLKASEPLTAEEQTSLTQFLIEMQPIIQQTSRTVALPAYTFDVVNYTTESVGFLQMQVFAKYACIAALEQAKQGNCYEAMETAALPIRLAKRPPSSTLISHLIGIAITSISLDTVSAISGQCSDTLALQRGLDLLTELRDTAFPEEIRHWRHGDYLGRLRHAAATGYEVDLSPQPMVGYVKQTVMLEREEYYQWIINNLPASDRRVDVAKSQLAHLKKQEAETQNTVDVGKLVPESMYLAAIKTLAGADLYAMLYGALGSTNLDEMDTRSLTALAIYDVTRMHLAQRLAELQSTAAGEQADQTQNITRHITTVPIDPFTSRPLLFSDALKKFYSVGPNGRDDKAAVKYDATNGTMSAGDIWTDASE